MNSTKETGLRLKLRLQDVPELAEIPWEFLFDASLSRFLARSNQTPIIRYIEMPEKIKPLKVTLPLKVLVITSSPLDYCSLGVERERSSLEQALKPLSDKGQLSVKWLEKPTLSDLHHCLQVGDYHVFHFIGHGGFDEKTQEGVLLLEDGQGKGCLAGADMISTLLHDLRSLRLVVLNSCEGARNSRTDPFAGVAAGLIRQGIPAVVAMQFAITDIAAITFSGELYAAISRGFPVDAAVAEARKAIYASKNEIEWGTPVLYMRAPTGELFDIQRNPPVDVPIASKKEVFEVGESSRDIIVKLPDSSINEKRQEPAGAVTGGTKKPSDDAKKNTGKQSQETAAKPLNGFVGSIVNAPKSARIVAIFVIALVALALIGLPWHEQPPIIPEQLLSLSVSPDPMFFDLGNMSAGETRVRAFSISNTGQGILNWNVSTNKSWMAVNPGNGTGSGIVNISINTTGLPPGGHSGKIIIDSNVGTKYYGYISLNIATPSPTPAPTQLAPKLKIFQNSFKLDTMSAGESKKKEFEISNVGGETLEWSLSTNEPWIELNKMSGSNNGSIFITIDSSGLKPGSYIGTIMVTSNGGDEQLTIEFNVQPPTPTATSTSTATPTPTATSTSTATPTPTPTPTPTATPTPTPTPTPIATPTPTPTPTPTATPTPTPTPTPTATPTPTPTPTPDVISGEYLMDNLSDRIITITHIEGNNYRIGESTSPWPWAGTATISGGKLSGEGMFINSAGSMKVEGVIQEDRSIVIQYKFITDPGRIDPHVWYPRTL